MKDKNTDTGMWKLATVCKYLLLVDCAFQISLASLKCYRTLHLSPIHHGRRWQLPGKLMLVGDEKENVDVIGDNDV